MKAAILYKPNDLRVENIQIPSIGSDEILLKVKTCGLCGTDTRIYHGTKIKGIRYPSVIGHEISGVIEKCGFKVFQPRDQHQCCGSAGTYNLLQNEIATSLRDKKVSALAALAPETIASGNIGCITQLNNGRGAKLPCAVVHTVELLDWATGGPFPSSIK